MTMLNPFRKKTDYADKMRVSFDLDEVLFVNPETHPTEPARVFPFNIIFRERLRLGTPGLVRALQQLGYEVWVYTSSFRTEQYIKMLFLLYGVRFDGIVNAMRHLEEVQKGHSQTLPQKVPSHYRISLHVDDEDVICSYGREFGFEVFQLDAPDEYWKEKVIEKAKLVQEKRGF